jgi:LPS-assembly lipoprotein
MLSLAGCGFHLRGATLLPEGSRSVYIATSDELTPFSENLRDAITQSGGTIARASRDADLVVRVLRDGGGRRVMSVSARNTPEEYEVYYAVEFTVDRGGQEVIERQPLEVVRTMSFDEGRVLAKDREEAILQEAMARDLAMLVVRRLESLSGGVPTGNTGAAKPGS